MYNKIKFVRKVGGANIERSDEVIAQCKEFVKTLNDVYVSGLKSTPRITVIDSYEEADDKTVVVPVGGDGTVLAAAKAAAEFDLPLIGINLGQVGFLTDLAASPADALRNEFYRLMYTMIGESVEPFKEDQRSLLRIELDDFECFAFNDFVVSDVYSDSVIQYELKVGESFAGHHKANAVIVATPTGSTAYAMNVGGALLEPDLNVMEVIPVAAMTMSSRPIIVGGKSGVTIKVKTKPQNTVVLKADGQTQYRTNNDISITIKQHSKKVRLLHFPEWNFFEMLSNKLGWNHQWNHASK